MNRYSTRFQSKSDWVYAFGHIDGTSEGFSRNRLILIGIHQLPKDNWKESDRATML